MTVKGHMRRLPTKRYHKSLVFHPPHSLALRYKLEFLPHPVIASIGHIGRLRHTHTHRRTQGQICDVVRLPGKVTWMSSQVGANIGLLSAPFFRLLLCLGICPTQPSLTICWCNTASPTCKRRWDAQTKDRWSIVLWKLVKTKPFIYMVLKCNGDLEQHPSWSPPSFAFDGFPWSCTIIDEMVLIDRPSEYYLLSNRVILSLQLTGAIRSTTSD